jgi:hypothetical protein
MHEFDSSFENQMFDNKYCTLVGTTVLTRFFQILLDALCIGGNKMHDFCLEAKRSECETTRKSSNLDLRVT